MRSKRRALLAVFCIAALAVGSMAATYAYFTDQEKADNTFTVGKIDITLDEKNVDDTLTGLSRDQENQYHLLPGQEYIKDPTVHVLPNSEDCYVYVTVENQIAEIEAATVEKGYTNIEDQMTANGWSKLTEKNGLAVYTYKESIAKSDKATDLLVFGNFKVDGEKGTNESLARHKDSKIIVNAYAIQSVGFDDAEHAWNTASKDFN